VGRSALATFGDGLVEAVSDQTFEQIAASEPPAIQGTVKMVTENFLQTPHVGRFGWKDDHAFLRAFSGDAYLNEMGITNPDNPVDTSNCAAGTKDYGLTLEDTGIEDPTGADGRADVDRFTDFMRALAPPPTMPQNSSSLRGAVLFAQMGCASCHQGPSVSARLSSSHVSRSLVDYLSALAEAHALYQRVLPLMYASHFLATRPACREITRGSRGRVWLYAARGRLPGRERWCQIDHGFSRLPRFPLRSAEATGSSHYRRGMLIDNR